MLDGAQDRGAVHPPGLPPDVPPDVSTGLSFAASADRRRQTRATVAVRGLLGPGMLAPAAVGFLTGAVFWHFIGFWGFVREIVYKGPVATTAVVEQTGPSCTSIVLERATGSVRAAPCPLEAAWLIENTDSGRADFAGLNVRSEPKRWSVTVQAEPDEAEAPAEID